MSKCECPEGWHDDPSRSCMTPFMLGAKKNMEDAKAEQQKLFAANSRMSIEIESIRSELAGVKLSRDTAWSEAAKVQAELDQVKNQLARKYERSAKKVNTLEEDLAQARMTRNRDIQYNAWDEMRKASDALADFISEKDKALARAQAMVMQEFGWSPEEYGQKSAALVAQDAKDSRLRDAVVDAAKYWRDCHNGNKMLEPEDRLAFAIDTLIEVEAAKKGKEKK